VPGGDGRNRKVPVQDRMCTGLYKRTPNGGFFPQNENNAEFPVAPGSPKRDTTKMGQLVDPGECRPASFSRDGKIIK
jgi:hypothetical protein